jgi:hypothetical protein
MKENELEASDCKTKSAGKLTEKSDSKISVPKALQRPQTSETQ